MNTQTLTGAEKRAISQAKRAAYKSQLVNSSRTYAERTEQLAQAAKRAEVSRMYGNAIRDISRDASRRGVTHNSPLRDTSRVTISTAYTATL